LLGQYYLSSMGFKADQGDCLYASAFVPSETILDHYGYGVCYCREILTFEWYNLTYGFDSDTINGRCAEKYFLYSNQAYGRFVEVDPGSAVICGVDLAPCIESTYALFVDPLNTEAPDNQFILGNRLQGVLGLFVFAVDQYASGLLMPPSGQATGIYHNESKIVRTCVYEGDQPFCEWMVKPIELERVSDLCKTNFKIRYKAGWVAPDPTTLATIDVPDICCPDTARILFSREEYGSDCFYDY